MPESPRTKIRGRQRAVKAPGEKALPTVGKNRPKPEAEIPLVRWADRTVSQPRGKEFVFGPDRKKSEPVKIDKERLQKRYEKALKKIRARRAKRERNKQ